jgi:hypothetical protein
VARVALLLVEESVSSRAQAARPGHATAMWVLHRRFPLSLVTEPITREAASFSAYSLWERWADPGFACARCLPGCCLRTVEPSNRVLIVEE